MFRTELPHLVGRGADQTELQLKDNATSSVDRRNQILLTGQSPGETTSELPLVFQYQDWTPKE
jgi:hypothetical protein